MFNTPDAAPDDKPDARVIGPGTPDAAIPGTPDAAPGTPDAAPPMSVEATVTHSTSTAITAGNSISCNATNLHANNSYYRVFNLPALGISSDFSITKVTVGIESATSGAGGTQPATVRLHTLTGALALANLTQIGTADVSISDTATGVVLDFPITATAPAGATLVAEFFTPDGQAIGHSLFIGSNALGQSDPSYLAAADCGATEPADISGLGFPDMHIVLSVTGTHTP